MAENPNENFVSLLTRHYRLIYTYIYALIPHRQDAEDVMQEVAVTLYRDFHKYTPNTNFTAWAKKIALYKIMEYRRSQKKQPLVFSTETVNLISQHIHHNKGRLEYRLEALRSCMDDLEEHDKQMIVFRYKKGGSMRELAEWYKVSLATIYRKLERIHLLLRRCVDSKTADSWRAQ